MTDPTNQNREPRPSGVFSTTQWTRVLAARGDSTEAQAALRELCEGYYSPVETFIRHTQCGMDSARDLTQEFFTKLLAGHGLEHVQQGKGRFRSYLLGAVKHFLSDMRDREQAAKRGGGETLASLDASTRKGDSDNDSALSVQIADPKGFPPDAFFDRQWALNLLERVLSSLAFENEHAGKAAEFETLKPWLTGDAATLSIPDAAGRLNVSPGAAKVAIHRLRKRFRKLIKTEIAATVSGEDEVSGELDYLIEALSYADAPTSTDNTI
jgi:DNA-directed RNA polymerase specialized sigma24 family protein